MAKQSKYALYSEVPYYRKQWFFWLTYVFLGIIGIPLAIFLLLTGDIYYENKGKVEAFGIANKIVAGLLAAVWLDTVIHIYIGLAHDLFSSPATHH